MIYKYERGEAEPGLEKVEALLGHYHLPVSTFISAAEEGTIPVLPWSEGENIMSTVVRLRQGGQSAIKALTGLNQIPARVGIDSAIALMVDNDTLEPVFQAGDTIVVDIMRAPTAGNIVVVQVEWETEPSIRKLRYDQEHVVLQGITSGCPTVRVPMDLKDSKYTIIGTVVELSRSFVSSTPSAKVRQ